MVRLFQMAVAAVLAFYVLPALSSTAETFREVTSILKGN